MLRGPLTRQRPTPRRRQGCTTTRRNGSRRRGGAVGGEAGREGFEQRPGRHGRAAAAAGRRASGIGGGRKGSPHDRGLEAAAGKDGGFDYAGQVAQYGAAFRKDEEDWDALATDKAAAHQPTSHSRRHIGGIGRLVEHHGKQAGPEETSWHLESGESGPTSFRNRWNAAAEQKDLDALAGWL